MLCDGAPDVFGLGDVDSHLQHSLVRAAADCARRMLAPGGVFVSKVYRGRGATVLFEDLRRDFRDVICAKPRCSRSASVSWAAQNEISRPRRG